jgi:7,8-dihydropterin-6-yl-methyl-4-(beta-D-ribofuranosyl)aminobenzene 5'-phosphate synthase
MKIDISRREFLKGSAASGIVGLTVDFRADEKSGPAVSGITEIDKLVLTVLTDNYYDSNRADGNNARRYRSRAGKSIHAEHGLSYFADVAVGSVGAKTSSCMLDFGLDPVGVLNNIGLLGIDVARASAFGLSHGHYDHYSSAAGVLAQFRSRIPAGTPFYVGEEAFARRFTKRPDAAEPVGTGQLRREDFEANGLKIVEVKNPVEIIPGAYFTGRIERVTDFEKVAPNLFVMRGEKLEQDTLPGEQAAFFKLKGKGLVILSACAHVGIVNTVRYIQKISATEKVHAIIGGFHLINTGPEVIRRTVSDIKAIGPDMIVPAHCTGFEAVTAFSREMPNEFFLNTAGTQYTFSA